MQIRDPIHGFIGLEGNEIKLLGTKPVQRLRGIKQLALASMVYPGALHTRFDHSLGVMHVAGLMGESLLGSDVYSKNLVRVAALLHDIGHGPFSHVSEYALDAYAKRATLKDDQKKDKIHELVTAFIISSNGELKKILGEEMCNEVIKLLSSWNGDPFLKQMISGPLDADKQDYLLRDSYFCGVQYGVFDLRQFQRSLQILPPSGEDGRALSIKADGIHAVEQYVMAKYYLTSNVYRHKVRLITDQMIVRAITLGIEKDELPSMRKLYEFDNSEAFVDNYAQWDDARFMYEFESCASHRGGKCELLLRRLKERNLLKRVFSEKLPGTFSPMTCEWLPKINKLADKSVRCSLEIEISKVISDILKREVDPDFVIYHSFDIKSVKEMSRNDEASILVSCPGIPKLFEEVSAVFQSISGTAKELFVEIYAPLEWECHRQDERSRLLQKLREPLRRLIEEFCRKQGETKQ